MTSGVLATLIMAAAFAAVNAQQSGLYPNFPFCNCQKTISAYSLAPTVKAMGNSTYCFTLNVRPPPGCTSYCCLKADVKKIEFNVNTGCNVFGAVVKATINGVPSKVGPSFDSAAQGPVGSTILRLTQLGLGMADDGAEVCITLLPNNGGLGCTTLEQMCVPPAGMPAGVCSTAMFDTQLKCCPLGTVNVPSPPPPPPPTPPPPPPVATPCKVCTYAVLTPSPSVLFPFTISEDQCNRFADAVAGDVVAQAEAVGANMLDIAPEITCSANYIKVCGTFASDADGALLQPWLDNQNAFWLSLIVPNGCPAYFNGYTVAVITAGDGTPPGILPTSCLGAATSVTCKPKPVEFPKCECDTQKAATPFAALPYMVSSYPGRKNTTTLYCFITDIVTPYAPESPCGKTTVLLKAEIFANETIRRKIDGMGVQPAGATTMKFLSPTWGAKGEFTLKATPLNWTLAQAKGGVICMELVNPITPREFCMTGGDTCWINFFDATKNCCPLFDATLV